MAITILKGIFTKARRERAQRDSRPRTPELFDQLDNATSRLVQHQGRTYIVNGVEVKTPTQVEQVMRDQGLTERDVEMKPKIRPGAGGKADIAVHIEKKT